MKLQLVHPTYELGAKKKNLDKEFGSILLFILQLRLQQEIIFGLIQFVFWSVSVGEPHYQAWTLIQCFAWGMGPEYKFHLGFFSNLRFFSFCWSFFTFLLIFCKFRAFDLLGGPPECPLMDILVLWYPNPTQYQ